MIQYSLLEGKKLSNDDNCVSSGFLLNIIDFNFACKISNELVLKIDIHTQSSLLLEFIFQSLYVESFTSLNSHNFDFAAE